MPDPLLIGDTSVKIIDIQREFDPQHGYTTTITWEGEEEALNGMLRAVGGRARVFQYNGPVYRLSSKYGDAQDGSVEVPIDNWEIDGDYAEAPFWESPKLEALFGGASAVADLKFIIL